VKTFAVMLLVLSTLSVATHARAQSADDAARLRAKLGTETAGVVMQVVQAAEAEGLPTRPLIGRAFEGASRGAQGVRIVAAVREQYHALQAARLALGSEASATELTAGSLAILTGVPPDSLASLRAARPGESLVVPLVVLSDLIAREVPVAAASTTVIAAARSGLRDAELLRMRERIDRDLERGAAPSGAAGTQLRLMLEERAKGHEAVPPARRKGGVR